jgi:YD repeat-containing protein
MRLPLCMMNRRRERVPSVKTSPGLLLALGTVVLTGCATTATTQSECYPHIFLDSRYGIQGTSREAAAAVGDGNCYHFVYQDGRLVRVDYRQAGALSPDPTSGVATIRIEHPEGFEKRIFLDAGGRPTANRDGAYAIALRHDDKGNAIEWRNLGADDRPKEAKDSGLAIFRWRYDAQGQQLEERHFGGQDQLKADRRLGVAIVRWQYDPDGNTVEESYFGPDGRPTLDRLRGVAAVRWQYGSNGKTVEESYYGSDGQLREDKNRGVAIVRWQYDANRNTVEERYLGIDQRLKTDRRLGVAIIRWQYDRYGREIGTLMLDPNEVPVRKRTD